jgi:uncharacterized membrane protein YcgQ (UPF0703/DUF1980 family)
MLLFEDLMLKAQEADVANAEDLEFNTRHGLFERAKACANFPSPCASGERVSAEVPAATKFPKVMMIFKGGEYSLKQIFNADETDYFKHLFLDKKKKHQTSKYRKTHATSWW